MAKLLFSPGFARTSKSFEYNPAETRYLIAILNQISGKNWQPFFDKHLLGVEEPVVE